MAFNYGGSIVKPEVFGRAFLPEKWRMNLERRVAQAGIRKKPYFYFGIFFYALIAIMILVYFLFVRVYITGMTIKYHTIIFVLLNFTYTIVFAFGFLISVIAIAWFFYQYFLEYKIISRTKAAEAVLEDYLRYVSENLRGGMNFEKSLWSSIRPEFGVLAEEMELVTKKVMTGTSLDRALSDFTEKYDSPMLKRSFDILGESLQGGGQISAIIDDLVTNLSKLKELKAELVTTNMSYTIFINAVVVFITPFLFALATQFVFVLNRIGSKVGGALSNAQSSNVGGGLAGFNFSGASLDLASFKHFAVGVLIVNSIGASILIAIINKGDWKQVGTSIFVYPLFSSALYLTIAFFASRLFGSLVPL